MFKPKLIGLTGKRGVGKSTVANFLVDYGFERVHAFDGGKAAACAYFQHIGATPQIAYSMTYGELRDKPSLLLPGHTHPRFFLEMFGKFMGTVMGPAWTLGTEIEAAWKREPHQHLVAESLVYEADTLRALGGKIIRIERPGHTGPAGIETDLFQAGIIEDYTVVNAGSLSDLRDSILELI